MKKFYALLVLTLLIFTPLSIWALYYGNPQWSKYIYMWQLERLPKERQIRFSDDGKRVSYGRGYYFEPLNVRWNYKDDSAYPHYLLFPDDDYTGPWKFWSPEGALVAECEYDKGRRVKFKGYNNVGQLDCIKNYRPTHDYRERFGESVKFKNGIAVLKIDYQEDDVKVYEQFYDNGAFKKKYTKRDDVPEGFLIARDEKGELEEVVWFYGYTVFRRTLLDKKNDIDLLSHPVGLFMFDESWEVFQKEKEYYHKQMGMHLIFEVDDWSEYGELKALKFTGNEKSLRYDFAGWDGFEILYGSELIYEHIPKYLEEASVNGGRGKKITRKINLLNDYKEELKALEQYSQPLPFKR